MEWRYVLNVTVVGLQDLLDPTLRGPWQPDAFDDGGQHAGQRLVQGGYGSGGRSVTSARTVPCCGRAALSSRRLVQLVAAQCAQCLAAAAAASDGDDHAAGL